MWDAKTWRLLAVMRQPSRCVIDAALSPDAKLLATADGDGSVHTWETLTGRQLAQLRWHTGRLNSVRFDDTGGVHPHVERRRHGAPLERADGTARLFECRACAGLGNLEALANSRLTRGLRPDEESLYLRRLSGR